MLFCVGGLVGLLAGLLSGFTSLVRVVELSCCSVVVLSFLGFVLVCANGASGLLGLL